MTLPAPINPPSECQSVKECALARRCVLGTCRRDLIETSDQVSEALADLRRHPDTFIRWPWAALDHMTGGLSKGDVHYVVAFSGIGKTTFVSSATNRWLDAGKKVYVLPLETQPKRFRTYLACQRVGVKPGDAFSGELRARNDPALEPLKQALLAQGREPLSDHLRVHGTPEINVKRFETACEEAADWGADIVIVDHIDHIEGGDGTNLVAESVKVNRKALEFAQQMGLLMVLCSQLNSEAIKGQDHLAKFAPPREGAVKYGTHKREVATGMLGLFRPVRPPRNGEAPEEYKEQLRRARSGDIEPHHALMPHTMGVVYMKDRNYGHDGRKALLAVVNGRVEDREERNDERRYGI